MIYYWQKIDSRFTFLMPVKAVGRNSYIDKLISIDMHDNNGIYFNIHEMKNIPGFSTWIEESYPSMQNWRITSIKFECVEGNSIEEKLQSLKNNINLFLESQNYTVVNDNQKNFQ